MFLISNNRENTNIFIEFFSEKEVSSVGIYLQLNYAVNYLSLFYRKNFCIMAKNP